MLDIFKEYVKSKTPFTDEQFELVKPYLITVNVSKGTVLLKAGEVCDYIYFVASGCLRSYIEDENNKSHVIEFASENWWMGDPYSLFGRSPSIFSIDAVEDSEVIFTGRDFYAAMPVSFPNFYMLYIYYMHESLRSIQLRLRHLLGSNGDERYLQFVATYPELAVRLPQHMIASYLGVSPESLSRIRNKLAQK